MRFLGSCAALLMNAFNACIANNIGSISLSQVCMSSTLTCLAISLDNENSGYSVMKLSIALTLLHTIALYEYIHFQVTTLQSHRLKLFGALQIHGLFNTVHLDSYLVIHHDTERENTPKAMLIYKQRSDLFKQMDDEQVVSSLFGAPVFTSVESLGA